MSGTIENPFPAKAVTTFGGQTSAVAELSFMRNAHRILVDYLKSYPAGAPTLALSGGHGTGKTYLLTWLASNATDLQRAEARVIYAKTDSPNLVDAYRELIRNLTKRRLLEVVNIALLRQGRSRAGAAIATQSESEEIDRTGSMETAFAEKILDLNELHLELRKALESRSVSSAVSQKVAFAIGLLQDAEFGEAAFEWIAGKPADLPDESLRMPLFGEQESDGGQVAIDALETIAALFKSAELPLIILLDQVENFIPAESVASASSIIKKLGEQMNLQSAMVVMAGTPAAWDHLPRDLWPRFHGRKPLLVGNLSVEETAALLDAYLPPSKRLSSDLIQHINDLSGGNSREILQIAHRAWESTGTDFQALTPEDVTAAARDSGSLDDRAELARQMLRETLAAGKLEMWPTSVSTEAIPSWIVEASSGAQISVAFVIATDARAEAQVAHLIADTRRQLESLGEAGDLLVVTVGYSSERVQSLLQGIARTVVFRETSFKEALTREIDSMFAGGASSKAPPVAHLEEQLSRLEKALADVAVTRESAERERAELLSKYTETLAEPDRQESEARTRIQLRDGLDALSEALAIQDLKAERMILRRLLIDNESYIKNGDFEFLGDIYFEIINLVGIELNQMDQDEISSMQADCRRIRVELISAMRISLSSTKEHIFLSQSFRTLFTVSFGIFIAAAVFLLFREYSDYNDQYMRPRGFETKSTLLEDSIISAFMGLVSGAFIWFLTSAISRPGFRFRRFKVFLRQIRRRLSRGEHKS